MPTKFSNSDPQFQMLAFNGDNATSNDTQTDRLHILPNSFDSVNRVRCFNHTMQISAKGLLRPFNATPEEEKLFCDELANDVAIMDYEQDYNGEDSDDDDDGDNNENENSTDDDDEDPFDGLDDEGKEKLLEGTLAVRITLNKVC